MSILTWDLLRTSCERDVCYSCRCSCLYLDKTPLLVISPLMFFSHETFSEKSSTVLPLKYLAIRGWETERGLELSLPGVSERILLFQVLPVLFYLSVVFHWHKCTNNPNVYSCNLEQKRINKGKDFYILPNPSKYVKKKSINSNTITKKCQTPEIFP